MQVILNESIASKPALSKMDAPKKPGTRNGVRQAGGVTPARRKTASLGTTIFGIVILAALVWGWFNRGAYITAETGLGYTLGIAGGVAMLTLLAYPLRKHVRLFRLAGPMAFWFRLHMALGIIGPTLILFHANFGLGSTNSNVAMWSMLIVAGSGLIGRFFYTKIHRGLYGKRAEARELMAEASQFRKALDEDIGGDMKDRIDDLETKAFAARKGMIDAAVNAIMVTARARRIHAQLRRAISKNLKSAKRTRNKSIIAEQRAHLSFSRRYFQRIEQAAELSLYERLFAAWHIFHLPLFFLLIITASIHVVAVHLY